MSSAILHQIPSPDFDAIRAMPAEDAAKPVVDILRTVEAADERIESLTRQVYAIRMAVLKIAWEKKVWEQFEDEEVGQTFRSGDRWLKATFPKSWRYCREALATANKLPDVPMEKLVDTSRANILTLTQVSSSVRALPDVLEAAQTLSEDAFAAKLTKNYGQALEGRRTLRLTYSASEYAEVERFLSWIGKKLEIEDRAGQLLAYAIDFNAEHQD